MVHKIPFVISRSVPRQQTRLFVDMYCALTDMVREFVAGELYDFSESQLLALKKGLIAIAKARGES